MTEKIENYRFYSAYGNAPVPARKTKWVYRWLAFRHRIRIKIKKRSPHGFSLYVHDDDYDEFPHWRDIEDPYGKLWSKYMWRHSNARR